MSVEIQTMGEGGIFEIAAVVIDEVLEIQPFTDVEYKILSSARDILAEGSILEAATVATNSANTAAGLASEAASAANDAAGLANSATTSANTAAGAANTAASSANSAASAANDAAAAAYNAASPAYGIKINISTGVVTRVGNPTMHSTRPIQNRMKGCLLSDAGVVNSYLPANSWIGADRTGASGQVMVEVPLHFFKCWVDGGEAYIMVSEYPIEGYKYIPKHYIGAYQAALDGTKLCSVANPALRGGNDTSAWDGTYRTLMGMPRTYMRRYEYKAAARARNASATTEWNAWMYNSYVALTWLMCIEYGTLNLQLPVNASLDSNGYKQGGLGAGVSNLNGTAWSTYNSYNPFITCGYSDSLGNRSGEVAFEMPSEYGELTTYVNRYRGVELPFGHINQWLDGINIEVKTDADGGTSKVYVCEDPANLSDTVYTNYEYRGLLPRTGGYVKEALLGSNGDIAPSLVGAGETSYYCDYFYTNVTTGELKGARVGGNACDGSRCGPFGVHSYYAPSTRDASFGSRLCFIPTT